MIFKNTFQVELTFLNEGETVVDTRLVASKDQPTVFECLALVVLLLGQLRSKLDTTAHNPAAIDIDSFGDEVVTRICLADMGGEGTNLLESSL